MGVSAKVSGVLNKPVVREAAGAGQLAVEILGDWCKTWGQWTNDPNGLVPVFGGMVAGAVSGVKLPEEDKKAPGKSATKEEQDAIKVSLGDRDETKVSTGVPGSGGDMGR